MKLSLSTVLVGLMLFTPALSSADVAVDPNAQAASAATDRTLVILNHTKADMLELYTSPVEAKAWGADQLGNMKIGIGGKVTVNLRNERNECVFDLMMVFADGEKVIRRENVCGSGTLTITERTEPELPFI